MTLMLNIKPWPLIRSLIKAGAEGIYIVRNGYITVQLPAEALECEFPDEQAYDDLPENLRTVFDRNSAREFMEQYAHRLIKSEKLSDQ